MQCVSDPSRWAAIRLLASDVDGVLTDGSIHVGPDGRETKVFHVHDGYGLRLLRAAGVRTAWISGRSSEATAHRARELEIDHLAQGVAQKGPVLSALLDRFGLRPAEVCYIGDDLNDLEAFALAGLACTVPGAPAAVRAAAHHVTTRPGGAGAVRELADLILAHRKT